MKSTAFIKNLFQAQPRVESFDERLSQAAKAIAETDCVLIGAGAGLSTAAGLRYDGEEFQREFRPWIEKYGITDLYTSSFYPWPSEEERWAYWAKHIYTIRFQSGAKPLYKDLLRLVSGKNYFVITTNVDGQFEKAGFDRKRIFATQGDYAYLQSVSGKPAKLYYDEQWVKEMVANTKDCRIPSSLVPHCPDNGELMTPNLRVDDTFVEDGHWHRQSAAYSDFVLQSMEKRTVLLEFGVGFNTPGIIRFPFEQMAQRFSHCTLIRFNKNECNVLLDGVRHFIPFAEELDEELINHLMDSVRQHQSVTTSVTTSSK
jgi:NAD-dependent SIR2 family protein deacetylase